MVDRLARFRIGWEEELPPLPLVGLRSHNRDDEEDDIVQQVSKGLSTRAVSDRILQGQTQRRRKSVAEDMDEITPTPKKRAIKREQTVEST